MMQNMYDTSTWAQPWFLCFLFVCFLFKAAWHFLESLKESLRKRKADKCKISLDSSKNRNDHPPYRVE